MVAVEGPVQVFALFQGPRCVSDDCAVGHGAFKPIAPTLAVAAEHGIDVIDLIALPSNLAMRAIARKFKMLLVFENGVVAGELRTAS